MVINDFEVTEHVVLNLFWRSVCENGKSESVLTRGLFDIFASPNSQNGPRFGEEGAKEVIQQVRGLLKSVTVVAVTHACV